MGMTLVTGATGLIGSHVARALVERGDAVRVTVRATSNVENLEGLEVERVRADLTDRRAVRRAMRGVERVVHTAGDTSLRGGRPRMYAANVTTTRVVLEEALRAGVQRAVYTSSVAAIGPAPRGSTADETQAYSGARLGLPYVDSKREAEVVAFRIAAHGLPLVIVNPSHVFGPGDVRGSSTILVRRMLARAIPAYVDGALNIVDVRDVARGHVLADEEGMPGERYILAGRNFTMDRLFADLGRLSGVEPPALKLPLPVAVALAEASQALPGPLVATPDEVRAAGQWWAYRATKAKRELGWTARPHEETLEATIAWHRERSGDRLAPPGARQPLPFRVAGYAARQATGAVSWLAG
ncbi:MAG: NAD-dependent epimerase/dehydratase family protein [Solirubrobacteraceae bacterium]